MNTATSPATLVTSTATTSLVLDDHALERMMKLAEIMATGKVTMPAEYRNSPGDCLAVVMQSMQWKMNPYAVAQKTHFVSGKIGYEGQLVNAAIVESGAIQGGFDYEWFGPWEKIIGKFEIRKGDKGEYRVPGWALKDEDGIGIRVTATRSADRSAKTLELLLAQARTRNSTLWADDPRQQLAYLAVKRWARLYTPGVMLGVYTPDELAEGVEREMGDAEVVSEPAAPPMSASAQLKHKLTDKSQKAREEKLKQVLDAIVSAATLEKLHDTAALAQELKSDEDKAKAREAYAKRQAEIKASLDMTMSYAQVADMIEKAKTPDELEVARSCIGAVADETQRQELTAMALTKENALAKGVQ